MSDTVRDVVVVGAPRSGTSMLAGLFADAGHCAGRRLIPPTPSNPTGFHEDLDVNAANDDLLAELHDSPWPGTESPIRRLRWIGAYEGWVRGAPSGSDLGTLVPDRPFVLKDPRFCYTLPAWRDVLPDVLVVVIVRHPAEVVASVRAMSEREPATFDGFDLTDAHLLAMWAAMHHAVLGWCDTAAPGPVTFVDCDDVRSGAALPQLSRLSSVDLVARTVRPGLHRQQSDRRDPGGELGALLERLRERMLR